VGSYVRLLSFGGGVNSVALMVLAARGVIDVDEIVFCDTGAEMPETYKYIERVVEPFCRVNNLLFTVTRNSQEFLYEHCMRKRIVPNRRFRWCTDRFKLAPLRKYASTEYGGDCKVIWVLGYAADEQKRADRCVTEDSEYPLISLGLDREGCKRVIRNAGLPVPCKSGCYICPFQSTRAWTHLYKEHPFYFLKAEALEKNGSRYPEMTLAFPETGNLEVFRHKLDANKLPQTISVQRELFCPVCEVADTDNYTVDYSGFSPNLLTPLKEAP
jgi:hypothetical protein